jgi:HEAT repeat protein
VSSAEPTILARLIRHLASTRCALALPAIREHVQFHDPSDDVVAACLSFFGECSDPQDLATVRAHLTHPTWFVRLQAATALGKIGLPEDETLLIGLLDDPHWWVRYRAAEALTNLPSMTEEKMERLQATIPSLEAQEIIIPFMAKLRIKFRAVPDI